MDPYLRKLTAIPPLDAETEHDLAARARGGDRDAREELITGSLRFVVMRARLYGLHGSRLLDAVQAGTVGLIEAVDRFDPGRGCRLSTYAWWWIGQAMSKARDVPQTVSELPDLEAPAQVPGLGDHLLERLDSDLADVLRARFGSGSQIGTTLTRQEVAQSLGLTVSQVRTKEAKALSQLRRSLAKVGHRAPHHYRGADPL